MDIVFGDDINSDRLLRRAIEAIGLEATAAKKMLRIISKSSTYISTVVKAEAILKAHAAEMTKNRARGDMFEANYNKKIAEVEASAFDQNPVDIVQMKENGRLKKIILNDRNRAEYIRQILAKEKGVKLVYSGNQAGAAKELGYQNASEARKDLKNKATSASDNFEEAKNRISSSITLQENCRQIFINKNYDANTEINLLLVVSAAKLIVQIAGLSDMFDIKPENSFENIKKIPESILKKAENQIEKLVNDFNENLFKIQKAGFDKENVNTAYKVIQNEND